MGNQRLRLKQEEVDLIQLYRQTKKSKSEHIREAESKDNNKRILVIPDLHAPFIHPLALQFLKDTQEQYQTTSTIFLGDFLDNHYSSYHETSADGLGGKDELEAAIEQLQQFYKAFPIAKCIYGNHDRIIERKAQTSNVSKKWLKEYKDVIGCPVTWEFNTEWQIDNIMFVHGEQMSSIQNTLRDRRQNIVYGHLHTQFAITYSASEKDLIFAMVCGCLIDIKKYAFEYMKFNSKRPVLGCGVIIDNRPILVPMQLN